MTDKIERMITMSQHNNMNEDEVAEESVKDFDEYELTISEQIYEWLLVNWKDAVKYTVVTLIVIFSGVLFIASLFAGNTSKQRETVVYVHPPSPAPHLVAEPPEETTDSNTPTMDEASDSGAYYTGVAAGDIFNATKDAAVSFWHGFNEATGASDKARDIWSNGRERINEWITNKITDHEETGKPGE